MRLFKSAAAVTCGLGLVAAGFMATPASAEPSGAPTYRELSGVGSDTTQEIINALSDVVTIGGTKVIGSYNATGGGSIDTRATGCNFLRPNGSGAGRTALAQALGTGTTQGTTVAPAGCVDFARSSANSANTALIQGIPFAQEAFGFAVNSNGSVVREWTQAEVIDIFKCGNSEIKPVLPQSGSGTRQYWVTTVLGLTDARIALNEFPCLTGAGTTTSRAWSQENDGRTLKGDEMMPYSMAQWTSQATAVTSDVRGRTVLGVMSGKSPVVFNDGFPILRKMYNFVPISKINAADARNTTEQVFATQGSDVALVCQQAALIQRFGFGTISDCGTPNVA